MEINFTVSLPRDALSVPVVRRVLHSSLTTLGVDDGCVSDIEIALTEACTNVLDHARDNDEYEVVARIVDDECGIDVIDRGAGFEAADHGNVDAEMTAEGGRGIQLIRALVDSVHFTPGTAQGTVVHFEKSLRLAEDAPLRKLALRREPGSAGLAAAEDALREREEIVAGDTAALAARDGGSGR